MLPVHPFRSVARRLLGSIAALVLATIAFASPAGAQYGGTGIDLFVDPRVPIDETWSLFGSGCAAGATVEIRIEGIDGVVATVTASSNGNYSLSELDLPLGLAAGADLTVVATCGPLVATAVMTLLCHDGQLPVDGVCEDGSDGLVGGNPPTTTTTLPDGSDTPASGGGDGGGTTGGSPDDSGTGGGTGGGGGGTDLAFTGASFSEILVQIGVTLFAAGFLLVVVARRRTEATA